MEDEGEKLCDVCEQIVIGRLPGCPLQCRTKGCQAYNRPPFDASRPIIWVIGPPGAGKGTQCKKIIQKYGFTHLSSGQLVKNHVAFRSVRSKCLAQVMEKGGLVPDEMMLELMKEAVFESIRDSRGYLIEGYPRRRLQGVAFEKKIGTASLILYLEAPEEVLTERMMSRAQTCGSRHENPDTIKLRLHNFAVESRLIICEYKNRIVRVNTNRPVDEIFGEISQHIDRVLSKK